MKNDLFAQLSVLLRGRIVSVSRLFITVIRIKRVPNIMSTNKHSQNHRQYNQYK